MTNDLYNKFVNGAAGREDLAALCEKAKENSTVTDGLFEDPSAYGAFCGYLKDEDSKVRKNIAKLAGTVKAAELKEKLGVALYEAYEAETTLFVRPVLLEALISCGAKDYKLGLSKRLVDLEKSQISEEDRKHISKELRLLHSLMDAKKHSFSGKQGPAELVLTVSKGLEDITAAKLSGLNHKALPGKIRVSADKLKDVLGIRTVDEFLFLIPEFEPSEAEPLSLAKAVAKSRLLRFLDRRHKEQEQPYRFRVEMQGRDEAQRTSFIKSFALEIEKETDYKLINSKGDYEIELRIVPRKDEKLNCYLKLYTLEDKRFEYRTESVAAGLKPYLAATAIEFASEYLREGANVLDPFCGTGTLLIERAYHGKCRSFYGIDTFGKALEAAKKNSANAGLRVNYINRDFFDFKHEYLFDEIITELPAFPAETPANRRENRLFYEKFFEKCKTHLEQDGSLIVLVKDELFEKMLKSSGFEAIKTAKLANGETEYCLKQV